MKPASGETASLLNDTGVRYHVTRSPRLTWSVESLPIADHWVGRASVAEEKNEDFVVVDRVKSDSCRTASDTSCPEQLVTRDRGHGGNGH